MPRIINSDGSFGGFICGGGSYTHLVKAKCPGCCLKKEQTVNALREVFGGWEAPDLICGSCGQYWNAEYGERKTSDEKREEGKALVAEISRSGIRVGDWPG